MADNFVANANTTTGDTFAADDIGGVKYPRSKLVHGADGVNAGDVSDANPLPVDDAGGSLTVDNATLSVTGGGVEASAMRVTIASDSTGVVSVDDNGASLTVDNAALAVTGGGVEASALRVTIASDSTGLVSVDDNGGSLTVDGTVAATQSGTWNVTNVSGTVSLPTGAATLTEQQTQSTALSAIQTAVQTLDNAISGTEMQVDVLTMPTVTVSSHDVTNAGTFAVQVSSAIPSGTNNIGDVDVLSVVPGTGATSLGKAIDSAAGGTDTGVALLAIRDDSLTTLTPVDGDYVGLRVNSTGALHVTGGGGGTQYNVDDVAGAADTGSLLLAIRDDSLTTLTPVDGDYVGLRVSSTGALHVTGGGGGTEYTEDVATPNPIVGTATMMERDDALGGLTPVEGDWAAMRCDANGALWVAVNGTVTVGSHAVTNAGTFAVQVDGAALTSLQLADDVVFADDAAFTLASSKVAMAGAIRDDSLATLTAVEGDAVPLRVSSTGALHVTGGGGGTEYTEDVATANPIVGTATMMERDDALSTLTPIEGDWASLRCDSLGALWTTISGTVAATQSGTWNVTNISGTISLPTGASTLAEQQSQTTLLGTIDTDTGAIVTAVQLIDDAIGTFGTATYSEATTKGMMVAALRRDTPSTAVNTDNEFGPLQMNSGGALRVDASSVAIPITDNSGTLTVDDGGSSLTVDNGGTFAVQATVAAGATTIAKAEDVASADSDVGVPAMAVRKATPANTSGTDGDYEMLQMSAGRLWVDASGVSLTVASHAVTNAGTFAVQVDGSALTALQLIDDTVFTDDAAFTPATSKVSSIGCLADDTSTDSVDEGDIGIPRMTLARQQLVVAQSHALGGATPGRLVSAATTNATSVKASAGTLYSVVATNVNAAIRYLKFYNLSTSPTVGTSTPVQTYGIPGNTAGAGIVIPIPACGIAFDTGIALALTTEATDAGTTAVAANEIVVSYSYK